MKNFLSEKRKYLFFLYKLSILMFILLLLDYSIGSVLQYFYFNQKSGVQQRTTYSIDEVKADFLVMGSSRANHHYYPDVFEKELGLSYYNAGRDGNFIFYHYAVLKSVLKRYTPEIIVLDIVKDEFSLNQYSYDRLSSLLPYYNYHPEIRPIVELRSPYEKIKLLSSIYPYNSAFFSILAGNLGMNSDISKEKKGYVSLTKTLNVSVPEKSKTFVTGTDIIKTKIFAAFIEDCISSGVRLFVICSPYYNPPQDHGTIEIAGTTAAKYGIPFFDFSYDSAFIDRPDLFADYEHLNDDGAKLFSGMIAEKIKEDISLSPERSKHLRFAVSLPERTKCIGTY